MSFWLVKMTDGLVHDCILIATACLRSKMENVFSQHFVIMVLAFRLRSGVPVCITHNLHYTVHVKSIIVNSST